MFVASAGAHDAWRFVRVSDSAHPLSRAAGDRGGESPGWRDAGQHRRAFAGGGRDGDGVACPWRQRPSAVCVRHGTSAPRWSGGDSGSSVRYCVRYFVRVSDNVPGALVRPSSRWHRAAICAAESLAPRHSPRCRARRRCGPRCGRWRRRTVPLRDGLAGARSVRCALRARRVTRAGAEGRGSCGVAAWRAGRPPAWPRRCDRARCCRTAPPSASRHRARAGRKHRTARSR